MRCFTTNTTSAIWSYRQTPNDRPDDICNVRGQLMNGYRNPRYSLTNTASEYHLTIDELTTSDSGNYICTDNDGYGKPYETRLVVLSKKL